MIKISKLISDLEELKYVAGCDEYYECCDFYMDVGHAKDCPRVKLIDTVISILRNKK